MSPCKERLKILAKKLGLCNAIDVLRFLLSKQLVAEMRTGPGYLCLGHHNSGGTCSGCNVCPPSAQCPFCLGFLNNAESGWEWLQSSFQHLVVALGRVALAGADGVGAGVAGAQEGLQPCSGWCWAGPAVECGFGLRV